MAAAGAAGERNEIPSDPITNPWDARTPYARREQWPARVDLELADGLAEEEVEAWSQSASIIRNGSASVKRCRLR